VSDALQRGLALLDINRPHDALEPLARAVAEDPEDAFAQLALAGALWETGDVEGTWREAARACVLAPEDPEGPILLALACGRLDRRVEALHAAREAVRLAPESVRSLVVLSQAELGVGRVAAAAQAARRATEVAPENPAGHHQCGLVLLHYGYYADAEEAFLKVLELDPGSASAQNNLALARVGRGDRREAIADLERAARNDPTMATVQANLERYGISPIIVLLYALAVAGLVGGVIWTSAAPGVAPVALLLAALCAFPAIGNLERRVTRLSPASAARLDDARRARRFRPWTWQWTRPLAVQAWWFRRLGRGPRVVVWYGMFSAVAVALHLWLLLVLSVGRCAYALSTLNPPPLEDEWRARDADEAAREAWHERDRETAARERALLGLRRRR
jgi:Flp pilus assembly protein TadD